MDPSEEGTPPRVQCRYCGDLHPQSFSHCPKTGRSLTAGRALVGRVISNRYRILALIGEGGMGAVYVAEHLLIGRKVAVKRLHPELAGDERAVARFQREARAAGSTGHEHVVEVLDLGYGDDGAPFLVMEYLRGLSLARVLEQDGKLPAKRACKIVGQVLSALAAVHRCGVMHRDLKPDNVLLIRKRGDPEFVKVVDFGISKIHQEDADPKNNLTRTGVTLGTPFYMSPEQARGLKDLDYRVDLYGVGVILYECLAGKLPFEGDNYHQLLQAILAGKPAPIRDLRPDIDPDLADIVERAIARDIAERYATADEFLGALKPHGAQPSNPGSTTDIPQPMPSFDLLATPYSKTTPQRTVGTVTEEQRIAALVAAIDPLTVPAIRPSGQAPTPGALAATPRKFVAQSPDWRPPARTSPFATPGPESSSDHASSGTRHALAATAPNEALNTQIKGGVVLAATEYIETLSPGALHRVRERLDPDVAARIDAVRLAMGWLRLDDYAALLRTAEREFGRGDGGFCVEVGVATADRELTTTHRLFMRNATPTTAIERMPQFFRQYHSAGKLEVGKAPTGGYRLEAFDVVPDTLPHAMVFSGFCRRLLELAGAHEARSSVVACRERGDGRTLTIVRWR